MSKANQLLAAFKANLGNWTCAYCGSNSGQPAAIFREIKKLGYKFEESSPNRWGKEQYCPVCQARRTHYKLLFKDPVFAAKPRIAITPGERARILKLFEKKDAFTGATITSTPEIDHKIPWTRLEEDIDTKMLTDVQIKENFQLLTREHNLLKDRACSSCKQTGKRPPLFDINFWYSGTEEYNESCIGCGWYDGIEWRKQLNKKI